MDVSELTDVPEWLPADLEESGVAELYPPQAEAVEAGVTSGNSLVASVPTASGKTLVAELAMLSSVARGGKALYIVPLRALASEKQREFERYEDHDLSVGVSTGNYESKEKWLATCDVIVATSEKVDSLVRNGAPWISELSCVVADEVHLVDDRSRGPTLEVTLAKLRRKNPDIQVVALSATIGNPEVLAEWLDAELVDSDWRPIDLRRGVHYGQAVHLEDGSQRELSVRGNQRQTAAIVADTLDEDGSTLVFVNSRKNAEAAARRLADITEEGLDEAERDRLASVAEEIRDVSDTETSDDLAEAVRRGGAFHHAGLCVTAGTEVLNADGTFEPIESIVGRENEGRAVLGADGFELTTAEVTDTFEMNERPVLEVETRSGNVLRLSRNHPLPTLGADGIEWVKAGQLETDECVARPRKLDIDPETPELRSLLAGDCRVYREYETVRECREAIDPDQLDFTYRSTYGQNRNVRLDGFETLCEAAGKSPEAEFTHVIARGGHDPIAVPRSLNEDVCWTAGAVAGDGFVDEHCITLTGGEEMLSEFDRVVYEQFEREAIRASGGAPAKTPSSTLGAKPIADLFAEHFGMARDGESDLRLPSVGLSDELLGAYLSGLFDADGSMSSRSNADGGTCVEFYSNSESFVTQVKTALLRFGILAHKDRRDVEGRETTIRGRGVQTQRNVYRLSIYGVEQLARFRSEIGFRHPSKAAALDEAIERNPPGGRDQNDVIPPGLGERIREERDERDISLDDLEPAVPKATLSRYENGVTPMKRSTFRSLAEALNDPLVGAVAGSELYWDRIDRITERKPEPLYDLSTSTANFVANGVLAHNTSEHRSLVENAFRERAIKVICATPTLAAGVNTPSRRVVVRDWRRYDGSVGGMAPLSTLEVHQMSGRAGRPGLDPYGEALLLAKSHEELEELFDRYIWTDPEAVQSKLAAEPALRTHVLATIASGFADSRLGLLAFLERTLYSTQTTESGRLERVADTVLDYLEANDFLERDGDGVEATDLGHTVSRLYLDPMSAAEIVNGLKRCENRPTALGLYQLVCRTPDMYQLYLRSGERERFTELVYERESEFLGRVPSEFEDEFEDWLSALKTGKLLEDWAEELPEDRITDRYGVGPGDIRGKVDAAQWLLGAAERLASEVGLEWAPAIRESRRRVEDGVREELIDLTGVRGVGRKRARRLFDAGIESRSELREADKGVVLGALRGRRKTAENVLENAGRADPSMTEIEPADVGVATIDEGTARRGDGGRAAGGGGGAGDGEDQSNLGDF